MPFHQVDDPDKLRRLLDAVLMLEGQLSLPVLLRHVVGEARSLVDARYGALGILGESGRELDQFLTVGLDPEEEQAIGPRPSGKGVLGLLIVDPKPLRLANLADHPESYGFPPNHPAMTTFLGVPIRTRDAVYGNLYLTDKVGGGPFTQEDEALVSGLALAAGIAIETARLHTRVRELTLLEDRDRIARDLHDTVIQRLFAVGLSLQGTARLVMRPRVVERIEGAVRDLDDTIRQLRTAIFDLEASKLSGLRQNVLETVEEVSGTGLRPSVTFVGPVDTATPPGVADDLLAVVREALTNVARHAAASHVEVTVTAADDLSLEVVDDGRGFDPSASSPTAAEAGQGEAGSGEALDRGHGLRNMASRADKLGGTMDVTSGVGGTRLVWSVPL